MLLYNKHQGQKNKNDTSNTKYPLTVPVGFSWLMAASALNEPIISSSADLCKKATFWHSCVYKHNANQERHQR